MLADKVRRGSHRAMFVAIARARIVESPARDALVDHGLVRAGVHAGRGEHPAIVGAAGLGPVRVDRAVAIREHEAVTLGVESHEQVAILLPGTGRRFVGADALDRGGLVRADLDEVRRGAATRAVAAGHVHAGAAGKRRAHGAQPFGEWARQRESSADLDQETAGRAYIERIRMLAFRAATSSPSATMRSWMASTFLRCRGRSPRESSADKSGWISNPSSSSVSTKPESSSSTVRPGVAADLAQLEVFLEEPLGSGNVRNHQVQVIHSHGAMLAPGARRRNAESMRRVARRWRGCSALELLAAHRHCPSRVR